MEKFVRMNFPRDCALSFEKLRFWTLQSSEVSVLSRLISQPIADCQPPHQDLEVLIIPSSGDDPVKEEAHPLPTHTWDMGERGQLGILRDTVHSLLRPLSALWPAGGSQIDRSVLKRVMGFRPLPPNPEHLPHRRHHCRRFAPQRHLRRRQHRRHPLPAPQHPTLLPRPSPSHHRPASLRTQPRRQRRVRPPPPSSASGTSPPCKTSPCCATFTSPP